MSDVLFSSALVTFSATQVEAAPATERGRELFAKLFGAGVASVNLPKSEAGRFIDYLNDKGYTHEAAA